MAQLVMIFDENDSMIGKSVIKKKTNNKLQRMKVLMSDYRMK